MLTRQAKRKADQIGKPALSTRSKIRQLEDLYVITWNMQGAGGGGGGKQAFLRNLMRRDGVMAICLQECGDLFGWDDDNLEPGWSIAAHVEWNAGGNNNRCSLAILSSAVVLNSLAIQANLPTQRPIIGAKISNRWVFCIHAPAGGNANYVGQALTAARTRAYGSGWIMAGDFNLAPGTVAPPNNASQVDCGNATHQNGNELDYAYAGGGWHDDWTATRDANRGSDHWPVKFETESGNWR